MDESDGASDIEYRRPLLQAYPRLGLSSFEVAVITRVTLNFAFRDSVRCQVLARSFPCASQPHRHRDFTSTGLVRSIVPSQSLLL